MPRSTQFLLLVLFIIIGLVSACAVPTTPSSASATRTITHAMGESVVPVNPQRVIVLDTGELDNALALGASIIGAPVAEALEYQAYLADQLDGITDTGTISEPSLETILTLKPDLILGSKQRHEAIYEQLSAIAPTVFTESLRVPWQDNFNLHAEALGKSAEAEALLVAYAARTAEIKVALGDNPPTISIIRFRPGQVRLYLKSSYIGYILQDVGLPRPPAQDQDSFSAEISLEQVADIDADYIFITGYAQDDSDQDKFLKSELWTTLGAVQNEQAIDVDDDTWITGLGVQSANLVLDDLSKLLGLTIDPAPATADAFPVTIEHKYGSTTITAKPERIVTVGLTDHDALLALGIVPVGTSEWFGGYPGSIWPWAQDELAALGGDVPEAVGGESINFETIAALQPDLILALYAGVTQEQYDLLTQIAPTVAQPAAYVDYGIPWQELTLTVGKAVGQAAAAQALVDKVEAQFVQVQADHPEFVGASAVATMAWQGIYLYGPQDIRSRLLTALGFVLPEGIEEITGSTFGGNLSMERADLLDTDVIIWIDPQEAEGTLGGPVYQALPVHTEGREVLLSSSDDPVGGATSFISVLSLPYLLENLVPMLVAALDGDPATTAVAPAVESSTTTVFPVTIEHKLGSTTIPAKPERVVSIGFTDQDYLLALGVVPVGIRDWFGDQPNAVWPWARHLLNGAEPEVLPRELNFEQIARLQPDLIVAIYTSLTPEEYDLLREIAPVVTAPAGLADYAITWQEQTRYTGQIVGQSARAEELVTRLEAKMAQASADHPEFAGTEYAFASVYGGEYYLYGERSTASRFLTALGFVVPADVLELTENENDYLVFSAERMDLVDRSLTLWSEGLTNEGVIALLENPLYTNLAVHTAGRDLFLGLDLYGGAFSFSSVLSLDLLVDDFVPALALALDGDPATVPVLGEPAAASTTRTVTDDLGRTVEVPATPQRIVALQDLQVLRPLLDLGVKPIASTTHPAYEGDFRFVEEYDVSSIETIGLLGEPNLEQLVLLKPDLIIGTLSAGTDTQLEQLSMIAPTLVYNAGRPVIEYHRSLAEAVGAVAAYEALMADYETRLADLRAQLMPIRADLTVSLLAFNPNAGQIEIGEGPYTLVFRGAGINQPDPQVNFESADEGVRRYWISPELLPAHDADLIFLLYTRDPAVNAPITDSAIWATLKAVQAGQVVEINGSTWYVQSVRSLFSVIDAMEQHLVEAAIDTTIFE